MNPRRLQSATIFSISGGDAFLSVMARADYGQSNNASQGRQESGSHPNSRGQIDGASASYWHTYCRLLHRTCVFGGPDGRFVSRAMRITMSSFGQEDGPR
jgi:hypothetical protein